MFEIGRKCIKLAGRDANKICLIIEILDDVYVMIDGQTRRRKCNINHLEPLDKVLKISKGASHKEVVDALKKEKIEVVETKPKKVVEKPKKAVKKQKVEKPVKKKKPSKKAAEKKETKKKTDKKELDSVLEELKTKPKVKEEKKSESKKK